MYFCTIYCCSFPICGVIMFVFPLFCRQLIVNGSPGSLLQLYSHRICTLAVLFLSKGDYWACQEHIQWINKLCLFSNVSEVKFKGVLIPAAVASRSFRTTVNVREQRDCIFELLNNCFSLLSLCVRYFFPPRPVHGLQGITGCMWSSAGDCLLIQERFHQRTSLGGHSRICRQIWKDFLGAIDFRTCR